MRERAAVPAARPARMAGRAAASAPDLHRAPAGGGAPARWGYWLYWAVLSVAMVVPFAIARFTPSLDYYQWIFEGHVVALLATGHAGEAAELYALRSSPMPNLASGVILGLLNLGLAPDLAGRVFLALTALVFAHGVGYLLRSIQGRPTAIDYIGVPWAFGYFMYMGFISYLFALGLSLFAAGKVHRLSRREHPARARSLGWLAIIGCVLYLAHLFGWLILVVAVGVSAAGLARERRVWEGVRLLVTLTPSLGLLGWYLVAAADPSFTRVYRALGDKLPSLINPLSFILRVDPFPATFPVFWSNVALALLVVGLLALNLARPPRLAAAPPLLAGALLLVTAVVLPFAWFAALLRPDERLMLPALLLLLASVRWAGFTLRRGAALVALGLLVVGLHAVEYRRTSDYLAAAHQASLAHIPAEARLLALSVYAPNLAHGSCWPADRWPTMGIPALQSFPIYRAIETGRLDVNIFGTGLLFPRERPAPRFHLTLGVIPPRTVRDAPWLGAHFAPDFPYIQASGCPDDLMVLWEHLTPEYARIAYGEGYMIFQRVGG